MSDSQELIPHRQENFSLGRLMPQNVRELAWFAGEASKSNLFQTSAGGNQTRPLTTGEAFMLMSTGIELGLTPLQGLRDLSLIKGKVDVPPAVLAAKIASDPRVTLWDPEGDEKTFEIRAKRSDRENGCVVHITWEDISQADQQKHVQHAEDFLYARCVRRIVKRYFSDLKYGLASNVVEKQTRVIDVSAVEREVGLEKSEQPCPECPGTMYLHASGNGGVYSQCATCGHRQSPPQEVRDAVRGRTDELRVDNTEMTNMSQEYIDQHVNPEPGFPNFATVDGRDPTPEERVELRKDWTKEILKALHDNMVDNVPHFVHKTVLVNWGWDGKQKVAEWLETKTLDELSDFHDEIMAVEL